MHQAFHIAYLRMSLNPIAHLFGGLQIFIYVSQAYHYRLTKFTKNSVTVQFQNLINVIVIHFASIEMKVMSLFSMLVPI
jgi:hypothetical protein